jgi:hypothetical protein
MWRHCACAEVCLPSRCLEAGCITPLFHCRCVYYLETAVSVSQPFLHGANTPQYLFLFTLLNIYKLLPHQLGFFLSPLCSSKVSARLKNRISSLGTQERDAEWALPTAPVRKSTCRTLTINYEHRRSTTFGPKWHRHSTVVWLCVWVSRPDVWPLR